MQPQSFEYFFFIFWIDQHKTVPLQRTKNYCVCCLSVYLVFVYPGWWEEVQSVSCFAHTFLFVYLNACTFCCVDHVCGDTKTFQLESNHFWSITSPNVFLKDKKKAFHKHAECHPLSILIWFFFYFLSPLSLNNAGSLCLWQQCGEKSNAHPEWLEDGNASGGGRVCHMFYLCAVSAPSCSLIRLCGGINRL